MRYCLKCTAVCSAFLFLLFFSFSHLSFGQANTGTILGSVVDPSGAPVPSCKITVKDLQTGTVKETKTDATR